jgi:hypothetical protein
MGQCPLVVQEGVQQLVVANGGQAQFLPYRPLLGAGARKAPAFEGENSLLAGTQLLLVHARTVAPATDIAHSAHSARLRYSALSAVEAVAWSCARVVAGLPPGVTAWPMRFLTAAATAAQEVLPTG